MSVKLRVIAEMQRVAAEREVTLPPLTISEDAAFPLTVGDFIRAYENVAA